MFVRTEDFLSKAIHDARVLELVNVYEKKGYTSELSPTLKGHEFDILFKHSEKDDFLIEVKVKKHRHRPFMDVRTDKRISKLKRIADEEGIKFRLAYVVTPGRRDIRVQWLEDALKNYIESNPSVLEQKYVLMSHVQRIENMGIESIVLDDGTAQVDAQGVLVIEHPDEYDIELPFDGEFELDMQNKQIRQADIFFDYIYV